MCIVFGYFTSSFSGFWVLGNLAKHVVIFPPLSKEFFNVKSLCFDPLMFFFIYILYICSKVLVHYCCECIFTQ